jgi:hypothetical protein
MTPWLCRFWPYVRWSDRGIGRALYKAGLSETRSSRGVAWGFGHPGWAVEFGHGESGKDWILTCERCGTTKVQVLS